MYYVIVVRPAWLWDTISIHHAFITLFARHQFGNHRAVLLVDGGLVVVLPTGVIGLATMLTGLNFWQLNRIDASNSPLLIIGADIALNTVCGKH